MIKTDWRRNIKVYKIDSVLNWFHVAIAVWVLIMRKYLSFQEIGMIYGLSLLWELMLELPSGAVADMLGRKKTIILARISSVAGFVVFCLANNFWTFLLANILYQTNWSLESGALSALLYDSLKENGKEKEYYKRTETETFFWCTVGMAGASVLGGWLYGFDIRWPYVVSVIIAMIGLISSFWFQEPRLDSEKFCWNNFWKQNREGFGQILRNEKIRAVTVFSVLASFVGYTGLWYLYEPRLAVAGFEAKWMGILVAGTYIVRALGTKLIPIMERKIGEKRVPLFLAVSQMVGSIMSFGGGKMAAVASVYTRKFADGFRVPILATIQNENIESRYRATALSVLALISNLLIALAGPVIGWANEKFGVGWTMGMFFWVGLVAVVPAGVWLGKKMG